MEDLKRSGLTRLTGLTRLFTEWVAGPSDGSDDSDSDSDGPDSDDSHSDSDVSDSETGVYS